MTSIVILSYNTIDYLQMCIESIRTFTEKDTYEIIVVDNGSRDGSAEWLKEQLDIRCIFNADNNGFPAGCNQGMAIAKGSEILLLNSDVIVTPRWLKQMLVALYSDENVGAVSCLTNYCSNFQSIKVPYKNGQEFNIGQMLDFAENYNHSNAALWTQHFTLVGFCFLFKHILYDKLGGLDERFSPGNYEDDDYSFRIMQMGYKLLLCRDTFIHHFGSGSFIKKRTPEEEYEHSVNYNNLLERNCKYFCGKWGVDKGYKTISSTVISDANAFSRDKRILIIARNRLNYLYQINLFNREGVVHYITDSLVDYELGEKYFCVAYNKDILTLLNSLKSIKYDTVLVAEGILPADKISLIKTVCVANVKIFVEQR